VSENEKASKGNIQAKEPSHVRFEVYGEEMIEKKVNSSSSSGRVYLPPNWIGHNIKIIRLD